MGESYKVDLGAPHAATLAVRYQTHFKECLKFIGPCLRGRYEKESAFPNCALSPLLLTLETR